MKQTFLKDANSRVKSQWKRRNQAEKPGQFHQVVVPTMSVVVVESLSDKGVRGKDGGGEGHFSRKSKHYENTHKVDYQ